MSVFDRWGIVVTKRLGVVLSAGGGAFEAMARIVGKDVCAFTVVTDRPCRGEDAARRVGAELVRIESGDRRQLSVAIATAFLDRHVDCCLLFFDRLVSADLFDVVATCNIHPAALPAFPGLTGVKDAYAHRTRLLGCSLHEVDRTVDGGRLLGQMACGVDPDWALEAWRKRAYLMKVYCGLLWIARVTGTPTREPPPVNASHALPTDWLRAFRDLQDNVAARVI